MRIDKQLEKNQTKRDMEKRFKGIYYAFDIEDFDNPKTAESIMEALKNIKKELERV